MEGILTTEVENQNNNTLQIYFGTDKEKNVAWRFFPSFFLTQSLQSLKDKNFL